MGRWNQRSGLGDPPWVDPQWQEWSRLVEGSTLTPAEMTKPPRGGKSRWATFLDKVASGAPFKLVDGGEVVISPSGNVPLLAALKAGDGAAYAAAFRAGVATDDPTVTLKSPGQLAKTREFGGLGAGGSLRGEGRQVGEITAAIDGAVESTGGGIDIDLGGRVASDVVGVRQLVGVKADVALVDSSGREVGYISLKAAASAKGMNQWGGGAAYAGHPDVSNFADDLRAWVAANGPIPAGAVVVRPLDGSSELAKKVTWGGDVSSGPGSPNSVDVIIASSSPIRLEGSGGAYSLSADRVWYSPEELTGDDWAPVLTARVGDRSDLGIPRTRIGVFPMGYRPAGKRIDLPRRP